jgi:tetratricopeptide (TPR) repeat protein
MKIADVPRLLSFLPRVFAFRNYNIGLQTLLLCLLLVPAALAQKPSSPPPVPRSPAPLPKPEPDKFDQTALLLAGLNPYNPLQKPAIEGTCFFPPLDAVQSPTVAVAALQIDDKAKKEYEAGCSALRGKKLDAAENHVRKALKLQPTYAAAWVTLGQLLDVQQKTDDAREACSRPIDDNPGFLPPYLCLAQIAARGEQWKEVLALSNSVLLLDPTSNFVAYGFNAAANLNLHHLPEAEKSAMRALEIDRNNYDPRMHFLLAQIYEAKGDPAGEAAQLREYLKYTKDPDDVAMVKRYLAALEKQSKPASKE